MFDLCEGTLGVFPTVPETPTKTETASSNKNKLLIWRTVSMIVSAGIRAIVKISWDPKHKAAIHSVKIALGLSKTFVSASKRNFLRKHVLSSFEVKSSKRLPFEEEPEIRFENLGNLRMFFFLNLRLI